jgi:hypothetical protein
LPEYFQTAPTADTSLSPDERAAFWREAAKRVPDTPRLSDEDPPGEHLYAARLDERSRRDGRAASTNTAGPPTSYDSRWERSAPAYQRRASSLHEPNFAEFWNVVTRPLAGNGMGISLAVALVEGEKTEGAFMLLSHPPGIYAEWKRLVVRHHPVRRILTYDTGDFGRYGVEVPEPASVAS